MDTPNTWHTWRAEYKTTVCGVELKVFTQAVGTGWRFAIRDVLTNKKLAFSKPYTDPEPAMADAERWLGENADNRK